MAISVKVCKNSSDKRALSKNLSSGHTVSAIITDNCDILNPTLELDYFASISDMNYMYISDWKRYYFIDKLEVIKGSRCIIHGHVDVLMTYKSKILECSAVVCRQQSKGNYYLNDYVYKTRQYKITTVQEFPNSIFTENGDLVLAVSGSESAHN